MDFFKEMLVVSAGGALGTALRFGVNALFMRWTPENVVWPTLAVNVIGSFLITLVAELAAGGLLSPQWRVFLTTGIMGGFTTYSAFNHAMVEAIKRGDYGNAAMNGALTVVLCLAAGFAGLYAASKLA
ncbi:MAG TPA: CrcB family protein [Planctomycetota bacterium]|nr:CrcB family protein [Planctomycetota bacterium]